MDRVSSLPIQDFDGMVAEIWQSYSSQVCRGVAKGSDS